MESKVSVEGVAFAKSRSMLSVWPEIRRRWAWMLVGLWMWWRRSEGVCAWRLLFGKNEVRSSVESECREGVGENHSKISGKYRVNAHSWFMIINEFNVKFHKCGCMLFFPSPASCLPGSSAEEHGERSKGGDCICRRAFYNVRLWDQSWWRREVAPRGSWRTESKCWRPELASAKKVENCGR